MITPEQVESRLKQLESEKIQMVANVNAIEGAIQDCRYWLEQLTEDIKKE